MWRKVIVCSLTMASCVTAFLPATLPAISRNSPSSICSLSMSGASSSTFEMLRVPWKPEKKPDNRQHPKIHSKEAKAIFDKLIRASKSAGITDLEALADMLYSQLTRFTTLLATYKTAWEALTASERKEVLNKQAQQLASRRTLVEQTAAEKKADQRHKRADKKFKEMDTDASGGIDLQELSVAVNKDQAFSEQPFFGAFKRDEEVLIEVQIKRLFDDMDSDRDGIISMKELEVYMSKEALRKEEEFWGAYRERASATSGRAAVAAVPSPKPAPTPVDEVGPNIVSDAFARLDALSSSAKGKLGEGKRPNELSQFREAAVQKLRQDLPK